MAAAIAECPASGRPRAAWRRARALRLASEGRSWDYIAREVGYTSRGTAHKTVMRALAARTVEAVDDHRAMELDRLDALQAAVWDDAMAGDLKAAGVVLQVIRERCKVLGLITAPDRTSVVADRPRTVVLSGRPADLPTRAREANATALPLDSAEG